MNEVSTYRLDRYWPCSMGRWWFGQQTSLKSAWLNCNRSDWISWLIVALRYENYDAAFELIELQMLLSGFAYTDDAKRERFIVHDMLTKLKMRASIGGIEKPDRPFLLDNGIAIWRMARRNIFNAIGRKHSVVGYMVDACVNSTTKSKYLPFLKAIIPFKELRAHFLGELPCNQMS